MPSNITEHSDERDHASYVSAIALQKMQAVLPRIQTLYALSADTIVSLGRTRLGKPRDARDAKRMITMLSAQEHTVYSAICVYCTSTQSFLQGVDSAFLRFRKLSGEEIDAYIANKRWRGAAGAYKLQEDASILIESIRGAPSTILGLPVHLFECILSEYARTNKISHL